MEDLQTQIDGLRKQVLTLNRLVLNLEKRLAALEGVEPDSAEYKALEAAGATLEGGHHGALGLES